MGIQKRVCGIIAGDLTDEETVASVLGYTAGFEAVAPSYGVDELTYSDKSENKISYARFIKAAAGSTSSPEYRILYNFLLKCFTDADRDFNGRIDVSEFDNLIEVASAAPRRFGYAPSTSDMYETDDLKIAARQKMFAAMDKEKSGSLTFDIWLGYCYDHIRHKAATLEINPDDSPLSRNKLSYIAYIKRAIIKTNPEYKELYHHLLDSFTQADINMDGQIGAIEFDRLIEIAAAAPRRFGLAPTSAEMYQTGQDRIHVRSKIFQQMDENEDGYISFDEWLKFSFAHIEEKVKELS